MEKTILHLYGEGHVHSATVSLDRAGESVLVDGELWDAAVMHDYADVQQRAVVVIDGRYKPVDLGVGLLDDAHERWPVAMDVDLGPASPAPAAEDLLLLDAEEEFGSRPRM